MYNDVKTVVFASKKAHKAGGKVFSCKTKCNTTRDRNLGSCPSH